MDERRPRPCGARRIRRSARAVDLVKQGEADAVVSAGNTGAVVVAATLKLRTLAGVERPAIATVMPTQRRPFVLIDAGANTDCTPELLLPVRGDGQRVFARASWAARTRWWAAEHRRRGDQGQRDHQGGLRAAERVRV